MTSASIYDSLFRSPQNMHTFSEHSQLSAMLKVEAALARSQAKLGIIPSKAADSIIAKCRVEFINISELSRESADSGNLAIPLIKQLTALVRSDNSEAAGYVHWGATSQDILDTSLILQIRKHLNAIEGDLESLCENCAALARKYSQTPMAGRTWLQHAVPITFGLKVAGWLDSLQRDGERLDELKSRVLVVQFGGASGTLASLGKAGVDVATELAAELDLLLPSMPWHANRDRIAEIATFHGLLMGTLGKIGRDVSLSMQTEVGELSEPSFAGRGGSSSMPHKRNPVTCSALLAAAVRVPPLVSTILSAMVQEHERALGGWQAEWETLPELCSLVFGALERANLLLSSLEVVTSAMERNLQATGGLLLAESVTMRLAESVGKDHAHSLVDKAARHSLETKVPFMDSLLESPQIAKHLDRSALENLLNPANYLGTSSAFVSAVIEKFEARRKFRREAR